MSDPTHKLGKGMIYLAWIMVLGLLTFAFNRWFEHERNPNRAVQSTRDAHTVSVELLQNRYGHYQATGAINGEPVEFLLDTGATAVSVPAHIATRLNLARGAEQLVNTANGTVVTYATRLERVRLGEIELRNVRAHINPGMRSDEVLLGMSFLRELEFTQRGNTLTLRQTQ